MSTKKYVGVQWRCLTGLILIVPLGGQTVDPQSLLASVRARVSSAIERTPKYACTDAIQRYWYRDALPFPTRNACIALEGRQYTLFKKDRLRLDITVFGDAETYSWPGTAPFEASRVDTLVKEGPITSGTFFAFLSDLFVESRTQYTFTGVRDVNGRVAGTYRFAVPTSVSHLISPGPGGDAVLAYAGSLAADIRTGVLLSVEISTAPTGTGIPFCSARLDAQYPDVQTELPLPRYVVVEVLNKDGERTRSVITYTDCRRFVGSSVIHFGETDPGPVARRRAEAPLTLPSGLALRIRLASSIDSATSWAGDRVEGVLDANAKSPSTSSVLLRKGTRVEGRLIDIAEHPGRQPSFTVELMFDTIYAGQNSYGVALAPVRSQSQDNGAIPRTSTAVAAGGNENPVAVFQFPGHRLVLGRNFVSRWVTTGSK
jgi:hypothetical protein